MLKKLPSFILAAILIFSASASFSQIYEPVKWSFDSKNLSGNKFEISYHATIDEGWHMYSQFLPSEDGPIATTFNYDYGAGYELNDGVTEPAPISEFDPNFEMKLNYFEGEVTFKQLVTLTKESATIKGYLNFMVCDASKCLPPTDIDFEFYLKGSAKETEKDEIIEDNDSAQAIQTPDSESQIYDPASWTYETKDLGNNEYELIFNVKIEEKWHIYSQYLQGDGPLPTEFLFEDDATGYELVGEVSESDNIHTGYDPNFDMELSYFENEATFKQKIKLTAEGASIKGELVYMTCDDSKCLPPEYIPFEFLYDGQNLSVVKEKTVESVNNDGFSYLISSVDLDSPLGNCGNMTTEEESGGLMNIFFLGFLGGLVALLTPCVFPMIPLTVSFFTKGSEDKKKGLFNAFTYGFFIFLVYIILSLPFHFLDQLDPNILNSISTNIYLNLAFFIIFIVFAISFFGYFEITMPSGFTNKMDNASNVGGLIGIFFMAVTLALVSFSCTGPILGSLLAGSLTSDGGAMQLTAGMGGFGFALALPFALFAAFPRWLNSLPKSGGWLNTVKVILGFVELALAIKFLSNADLVEHWGIVKIEVFLILWIIIGIGLALYLFGKIMFPHDSPVDKLPFSRIALGALTVAFIIYLASGFRYNEETKTFTSLTLLSGLAPPAGYSWMHPNHCPLNLSCFHDYDEGLAYAKQVGKPIMIDFTGWACVNCRKMEEQVWKKPEILKFLQEEYVLISLYVDDRQELPEEEQGSYTSEDGRTKRIRTIGDKWATLQTETFINNSQPYYVLISENEELLSSPVGYTPDVSEYKGYLQCGLDAYQKLN